MRASFMLAERSGGRRPVTLVLRVVAETDGRRGLHVLPRGEIQCLQAVGLRGLALGFSLGGGSHFSPRSLSCTPIAHEAITLAQINRVVKWKECTAQYVLSGKVHI